MSSGSRGGNGVDLGHVAAMLGDVLVAQEAMRADLGAFKAEVKADLGAVRAEVADLRADHGRKLDDLASSVSTLRQAVTEYHSTVLGHGILITELDERVRRVERHLNLPPAAE